MPLPTYTTDSAAGSFFIISRRKVMRPLTWSQWLWVRITSCTFDKSMPRSRAFSSTVSGCAPVSTRIRWPSASTKAEKPHSPTPAGSPTSMVESTVMVSE